MKSTQRFVVRMVMAILLTGCDQQQNHVPTHVVSGKVTFQGKPVPAGMVVFEAETPLNEPGHRGIAQIINGAYRTKENAGARSGKNVVFVTGFSGVANAESEQGAGLFPTYRVIVELPQHNFEYDVEVPDSQ